MSARNYVAQLEAPLLNLQGTADEAVDFQQLDMIIRDCTDHAKDFAALYYPNETHVFNKRSTWADAVPRILAAFDRYLMCDPAERPRAML
jgi:dipeptidyl aminopeptidase/acylaminoacyl peptidase